MNYILEFNPHTITNTNIYYLSNIEEKIKNKESITIEEATDFLNIIIFSTRYKINPNLDNYDYKCDLAQSILYYYFKNLNCNIHPCATQKSITTNITGHSFLTLELIINNEIKHYLLDPTYIQFFKKNKCIKDNYFTSPQYTNYILLTPDPGYFIKGEMKKNANYLINHGFIELTEETAQMYGDSFYNTKTGLRLNNTYQSIPGSIYINSFLKGNTKLSKSEEELINQNLYLTTLEELSQNKKTR